MSRQKTQLALLLVLGVVASFLFKLGNINQFLNFQFHSQSTAMAQGDLIKGDIPVSIMPCLPQGKAIKKLEMEASTKDQQKSFYLVTVEEEVPSDYFDDVTDIIERTTVIQEDDIGCLVLVPRENERKYSLTRYLPTKVARQLALNFTKRRIELVGSKEAYINSYDEILSDAADGPWIFFPEDAWAYEQLGLPLPDPHVIVNSADEVESPTPGID